MARSILKDVGQAVFAYFPGIIPKFQYQPLRQLWSHFSSQSSSQLSRFKSNDVPYQYIVSNHHESCPKRHVYPINHGVAPPQIPWGGKLVNRVHREVKWPTLSQKWLPLRIAVRATTWNILFYGLYHLAIKPGHGHVFPMKTSALIGDFQPRWLPGYPIQLIAGYIFSMNILLYIYLLYPWCSQLYQPITRGQTPIEKTPIVFHIVRDYHGF